MTKKILLFCCAFVATAGVLSTTACVKEPQTEPQPMPDEDINLGGATSIEGVFVNIFQQPAPNLSAEQQTLHLAGDRAFGDKFVTAPSTINGGLGPVFNQNSCENCHVSNGRSPFPIENGDMRGLLMRLSAPGVDAHGAPIAVAGFGKQLQTQATFGKQPEGKLSWSTIESIKQYLDGTTVALRHHDFMVANPYTTVPSNALRSVRIAPPVIGLGLLEAIKEADLLALANENDANGDGISGKPNRVWDFVRNAATRPFCRRGWRSAGRRSRR